MNDLRDRPEPNAHLVRVFDAERESEAMVVKGLLDSFGVDADITSIDAVQETFPGVGGAVILVREEDAARARKIIEESRQPPPETEDGIAP